MEPTLIKHLKQGDIRAFDTIYQLYASKLLGFCMRYVKSREDAEEIVQDTFVALWNSRESIKSDSLKALIFAIARNRLVNAYKSRINSPVYEDYVSDEAYSVGVDGTPAIEYDEFEKSVYGIMDSLPPTQSRVLRLSRIDGLSHKEISEKTGLSLQTVKNAVTEGMRKLKDELSKRHNDIFIAIPLLLSVLFRIYIVNII